MQIDIIAHAFEPYSRVQAYQTTLPSGSYGATCVFVGTMRDFNDGDKVQAMTLEHYPEMTRKQLGKIVAQARQQWAIEAGLLVHRVGDIHPADAIVLVAVWTTHRGDGFDACRFIIEQLKHTAPFWKKEHLSHHESRWVSANSDGYKPPLATAPHPLPPRIFVRVMGQGKSIVLLHGWAMHSDLWLEFAENLAQTYRVICVDLPGHGQSENLAAFELTGVSDALVAAVGEVHCCWLGWSLGASIALDIAHRYPEKVSALILLAGNPYFHAPAEDTAWRGVDSQIMDSFAEQLKIAPQATLLKFLLLQTLGLPNAKALMPQLKAAVLAHRVPDYDTLQQALEVLKRHDLRPALAALTLPTALILGGKDTLVPVAVAACMQQLLPPLNVYIIDKAGHIPFLSHQDELLAIVRDFMAMSEKE